MEFYQKNNFLDRVIDLDSGFIKKKAAEALLLPEEYFPDFTDPLCHGQPGDFSSWGDYWWPDPKEIDGIPYIRRDGESNPDLFMEHRRIMRSFRTTVSHLTAGYLLYGDKEQGRAAVQRLKRFFVDPQTRMNPHMLFAQAIPGICTGRGVGIIDTLHLIETVPAALLLEREGMISKELGIELRAWFSEYLTWINEHPQGVHEKEQLTNHGICWDLQAAVFARYTGNETVTEYCRNKVKEVILQVQMNLTGGFDEELGRTKPYGYSLFVLDQFCHLCHVLSQSDNNLWDFTLSDGRSVQKGLDFLFPYMKNKETWSLPPDVEHFNPWPVRQPSLLFGAAAYGREDFFDLWKSLESDPADREIRRNLAVRQSILWLL
jgi:hypothetical protein